MPSNRAWEGYIGFSAGNLIPIFSLFFVMQIFDFKQRLPRLCKILFVFFLLNLSQLILFLVNEPLSIIFGALTPPFILGASIGLVVYAFTKHLVSSGYLFVAYLFNIVSWTYQPLFYIGKYSLGTITGE